MENDRVTALSDAVADALRLVRKREGMTRAEFASTAWETGAPKGFTAAVLGYIESGRRDKDNRRRREVTVDELVFLARAAGTTPLGLLGEHATLLGGDEPPECPRCAGRAGPVEKTVREDIEALDDLEGTEPGLAETAYVLAAGIDAGGGEDGRSLVPALAKELRATLKALTDAQALRREPTDEGDALGGLGDPD